MKRRIVVYFFILNNLFMGLLLMGCNELNIETKPTIDLVLPIITIETPNAISIVSDENYISCFISLSDDGSAHQFAERPAGIRRRGNSTQQFDKKPYRIKFNEDIQLLGLGNGASKSWILLAEYVDYSMLRNKITFDLAKGLLRHSFVSDTAYVEVVLNGISQGVYLVAEQTHVNQHRVHIDESGVNDLSIVDTGYLLELEGDLERKTNEGMFMVDWFDIPGYSGNPDELGWWNLHEHTTSKEPSFYVIKSDAKSAEQVAYIQDYMVAVYDAIYMNKTESSIKDLINIESAVDMYILQLLTNDYDNNFSSTFLFKDKSGKIVFGPPWDFDLSYGNHLLNQDIESINMFHLLHDLSMFKWFQILVIERWQDIAQAGGIIDDMIAHIDEYTEVYHAYFESNHLMWLDTRETTGWHFYYQTGLQSQSDGATHLKNWINERINFIQNYFNAWHIET